MLCITKQASTKDRWMVAYKRTAFAIQHTYHTRIRTRFWETNMVGGLTNGGNDEATATAATPSGAAVLQGWCSYGLRWPWSWRRVSVPLPPSAYAIGVLEHRHVSSADDVWLFAFYDSCVRKHGFGRMVMSTPGICTRVAYSGHVCHEMVRISISHVHGVCVPLHAASSCQEGVAAAHGDFGLVMLFKHRGWKT